MCGVTALGGGRQSVVTYGTARGHPNQNNSLAFAHTAAHGITHHTSLILLHQFIVHATKARAI
jgi:hypothetical protein